MKAWLPGNRPIDRNFAMAAGAIALVAAAQVVLVFTKAINWDEFLHYGIVYDLPRGRVVWDLQTIYARLFLWVPGTGRDIVDEILTTRLIMLGFELLAMVMVVLLARRFVDGTGAALAGLLYVTGGYTFLHGFSFRPDPMVAGLLMSALYLLAQGRLDALRIAAIGALVGFAGLANMKAIFYLPCFAGIALLLLAEEGRARKQTLLRLAAIPLVALAVFAVLHQLHKIGIAVEQGTSQSLTSRIKAYVSGEEMPRYQYSIAQAMLAPLITTGIVLLPIAWKGRARAEKMALAGLVLPLASLFFYRNTFPYYFTFILPPVCVAVSVSLALIARRYPAPLLVLVMLATPVLLWVKLDRTTLPNQRFLIGEVHRLFPEPTGYLSYTSYVSDYPRIIPNLISGVGLKRYLANGEPMIANAIEHGEVGFVLDDTPYTASGLRGATMPGTLLPADFAALGANFLHYEGPLWVYGKQVCGQAGAHQVLLHRGGPYSLEGAEAVIDGRAVADGETVPLARGEHAVSLASNACVRLWALPHPPEKNLAWPEGPYGDRF